MKIVSYNINGIRSGILKGLNYWILKNNPDIICLQEIRANFEQINVFNFKKMGYYHYWFSSKKKGYSGVGILSKEKPYNIEYGIGIEEIDKEGRVIRIDLNNKISVISVYVPSGNDIKNRLKFKFFFLKKFFLHIKKVKKKISNLIICGDYNICHNEIDIYDPINNKNVSGFLLEEREWMSNFINLGFIDSFRNFVKTGNNYSWWSYRNFSKINNRGWRIDYVMISDNLKDKMINSYLMPEVCYSDHCPVVLEIKL
ncbi:exodeoxyribonuclease III [Blattabacterium cuenoti]|uniref:exodeoxyribonuclease III n=1 Tax=Blattabacterium cuenoti TaxID=1653831 RepID=UPI00163C34BA|nr:exodeoxyribonuclease III [Blattabacterium cuenoti]